MSTLVMFIHTLGNTHSDRYLIASKKNSQKALNNIFTTELIWCLILLAFFLLATPWIMKALGHPELALHAQVFSIIVLQNPLIKPKALLEKKFSFFKAVLPSFISNILGGAAAIVLVQLGYGLWSLVWWKVVTFTAESIITWIVIPYRPKLAIDTQVFREYFKYSSPVMFAAIIAYIYSNIDYYMINNLMDAKVLGFYWVAYQASHYLLSIRASVNRVIFPFVSRMDSTEDQKSIFNIMTSLTSVVFFMILFLVLLFADDLVILVYGVKWLPSAILIKVFTSIVLFKAVQSNAVPLLHASGITMPDLEISLLNFFLLPPLVYYMTSNYGSVGAACALLVVGNISIAYIHLKYVKPLCGQGYFRYYGKILFFLFLGAASSFMAGKLELSLLVRVFAYIILLIMLFIFYLKDIGSILTLFKQRNVQ